MPARALADELVSFEAKYGMKIGGEPTRYEEMDKICDPKIEVKQVCCLKAAKDLGPRVCLLCMGDRKGPLRDEDNAVTQHSLICRATTLKLQWKMSSGLAVPQYGGIYVPDVVVKDEKDPFTVSMVYAFAPWAHEGGTTQFLDELREKINCVLRICYKEAHQDLVLGAWGCGKKKKGPPREVAKLFKEALLGQADVSRRFRSVVFAIDEEETFQIFQEEFGDTASQDGASQRQ